jgi:hypothetical protein
MADSTNILEGVSRIFIGTASTDVLPADTVAFGASWGGTWRDMGYTTEDGIAFSFSQPFNPVATAQTRTPPLYLPGATEDSISCTLLEATLLNLKAITGRGTITTLAPSGPTPGYEKLTLSAAQAINRVAIGFEGVAPPNSKSNPRRVLFPNAMATAAVTYNQRIGQATGIPCQFSNLGGSDPVINDTLTS